MSNILDRTFVPSVEAMTSAVGDETVILHLGNGTYYGLDPVGTCIWQMLGDGIPIRDICRRLSDSHAVDPATIELDAQKFLSDLLSQGILVDG